MINPQALYVHLLMSLNCSTSPSNPNPDLRNKGLAAGIITYTDPFLSSPGVLSNLYPNIGVLNLFAIPLNLAP